MNKTIAIVIAVVVVLGVVFMFMKGDGDESQTTIIPVTNPMMEDGTSSGLETTNPSGKKMAFDVFLKQGGSYMCTVTQHVGNVDSTGTIYVDGEKMRGEFNSTVSGKNVDNIFVSKDGFYYTWSSMAPNMGFKMGISQSAPGTSVATSGSYNFNAESIGDYDCKAWSVDSSKFALPSNVKFTDMSSLKITP